MSPFKNKKDGFFAFSSGERRGSVILLGILVLIISIHIFIPHFIHSQDTDFSSFQKEITQFEQSRIDEKEQTEPFDFLTPNHFAEKKKLTPFPFDPNQMDAGMGEKLGLSLKQTQSIENYLHKGGRFRKKEDFKKMYCISESMYKVLESYIIIPEQTKVFKENTVSASTPQSKLFVVELNSADTLDLKELKGIGSGFARKIINYKKKLGGYISKFQLLEVYGFTPELLAQIEKQLTIDATKIRKIDINTASLDEMKQHPYWDYYIAKAVYRYRTEHQKFNSVDEVQKISLITPEVFQKIKPYLSVE